jgi:hypothetical protein
VKRNTSNNIQFNPPAAVIPPVNQQKDVPVTVKQQQVPYYPMPGDTQTASVHDAPLPVLPWVH